MKEETGGALTSNATLKRSKKPASNPASALQHGASACTSIPASTPSYKSFNHIRDPKARRAKEYEQHLLILRDMFPEYTEGIDTQLAYAHAQQKRTPASDRERISVHLKKHEMLTCREISEDLEMPYATCYKILREGAERGTFAAFERKGIAGNKPYLVWTL